MKGVEVEVALWKSFQVLEAGKSESGFDCGVFRTPGRRGRMEVDLFLLSVFLFGKVISVAGVVGGVFVSSIIGASRSL